MTFLLLGIAAAVVLAVVAVVEGPYLLARWRIRRRRAGRKGMVA